jgi:hypothetical protein
MLFVFAPRIVPLPHPAVQAGEFFPHLSRAYLLR